jgi:hypothetical protein
MDKKELVEALNQERESFLDLLEGLPDEAYEEPGVVGDWSLKDIIAHISMWEGELIRLLWQINSGQTPTTAHFRPLPVDEVNSQWYELMKDRQLNLILDDFHAVRNQTIRRLEGFSDRDLADPRRYPWLKGRALWEWIADDSFEHEAEHGEQIRHWLADKKFT